MKKRIVALILTGMMVFTLNGCGTKGTDAEETVTETQSQDSLENQTEEKKEAEQGETAQETEKTDGTENSDESENTEAQENEANATETNKTETNETADNTANEIKEGENLVIPISDLSGKATFYPVEVDGTEMEVIAGKDSQGEIRTAFNTCQVCYDSGNGYYRQLGDELVCQNCGNSFTMDVVGETAGGCNPVPILEENRTVTDSEIQISYEFLKESSNIFANWRS